MSDRVVGPQHDLALELGKRMCAALDLDPARVTGLTYYWTPHELPTVTVDLLMTEGVVREVLRLVPADHA